MEFEGALPPACGSLSRAGKPPELVEYKGLTRYIDATVAWLANYDEAEQRQPRLS